MYTGFDTTLGGGALSLTIVGAPEGAALAAAGGTMTISGAAITISGLGLTALGTVMRSTKINPDDYYNDGDDYEPYSSKRPQPKGIGLPSEPSDCPRGVTQINKMGWSTDKIHALKRAHTIAADAWVGISDDNDVIITGPTGNSMNLGPTGF
jgi:hypothetical protein